MTLTDTLQTSIKNWWLFIIKGLALLAAGIFIFSRPLEGYIGLSIMFSVVILVSGFSQIFFATANTKHNKGWGWTLVSGVLDVIIGIYLYAFPLITMATLPFILGFWLILRSFYLMGSAYELKALGVAQWGWLLFGGIVLLAASFFVLYYPAAGAVSIIVSSGVAFLIGGFLNIFLAFRLKALKK
ncbi:HdeD family acid-resistance protein [Dinghuibacter silviterrae]|uniref:Uncharacterized membrane protein HdeD (DUF308 family) n=1 Tax=Dinghuibacter silviterrae TaxID=1539049 RepID=A0A4R8DVD6_9BACT|nr:DUF308 domain-containing protein [Dinghuibacter silviterrae]TDX02390.1 uncharacterized membrane protein HdeD (DUF308 family) [Dinghuibacter silviterrae]